ncbi:MAG: glycine betaine ABC transporter substrate-binding protein [Clostridiales bacterium]|nr:glycine betaine ABC transporter substrate-binding protein [Clostridiales bacterium]MCF8023013.1 glycine betaine ABC transporter substrate-binding protein [Clostridiales bacterium]
MKKLIKVGLVLVLMLSFVLSGCASGQDKQDNEAQKKDETITFGVTPWSSTVPPTQVARLVLEDMGYEVELQEADVGVVYTGLASKDIDVFMDAWLPVIHRNYMNKHGEVIDDVSVSYPNGDTGWVVPKYMEDINSVEDLKGKEDLFNNEVIGIDEGAGMTKKSRKMIEAYDLDLKYVPSSETGMLAEAKRRIDKKKPIIFLGWRPHTMFVKFDVKLLDDPKGYLKASEVHVLTRKGLKEDAPEAYEFLSNWSMPVEDVENMLVEMDDKDRVEAAQEWIENNQDKVNEMLNK